MLSLWIPTPWKVKIIVKVVISHVDVTPRCWIAFFVGKNTLRELQSVIINLSLTMYTLTPWRVWDVVGSSFWRELACLHHCHSGHHWVVGVASSGQSSHSSWCFWAHLKIAFSPLSLSFSLLLSLIPSLVPALLAEGARGNFCFMKKREELGWVAGNTPEQRPRTSLISEFWVSSELRLLPEVDVASSLLMANRFGFYWGQLPRVPWPPECCCLMDVSCAPHREKGPGSQSVQSRGPGVHDWKALAVWDLLWPGLLKLASYVASYGCQRKLNKEREC